MRRIPERIPAPASAAFGAAAFALLAWGTTAVMRWVGAAGPVPRQLVLKGSMIALSFGLMLLIGRGRRVWGFGAPRSWIEGTLFPTIAGGLLGAVCSGLILGLGLPPMAGVSEMGLVNVILVVWFGSTISEEIFVRGLVQGWMQPLEGEAKGSGFSGPVARVIASGALFGALHLSLFLTSNDPRTSWMIVGATTLLGLVCAWSRERSKSLVGPLLAHFAFNVCGVIGGAAVMIARMLLGG